MTAVGDDLYKALLSSNPLHDTKKKTVWSAYDTDEVLGNNYCHNGGQWEDNEGRDLYHGRPRDTSFE